MKNKVAVLYKLLIKSKRLYFSLFLKYQESNSQYDDWNSHRHIGYMRIVLKWEGEVHSIKAGNERKWEHKRWKYSQEFNNTIGLNINHRFKSILYWFNLLFKYKNICNDFLEFILKIFKICFYFVIKESLHMIL